MRASRIRLNRRRTPTVSRALGSGQVPILDIWSKRVAEASQIGVLILGVFGYIYTVLPVYNKAKLEQQIEEKAAALEQTSAELRHAKEELELAKSEVEDARRQQRLAANNVKALKSRTDEQYREIRIRLAVDLQSFGRGTCPIFPKGSGALPKCLSDLIGSTLFDSWSLEDRQRALRHVRGIANLAVQLEQDVTAKLNNIQADLDEMQAAYETTCRKPPAASQPSSCMSLAIKLYSDRQNLINRREGEHWQASKTLYETLYGRLTKDFQ